MGRYYCEAEERDGETTTFWKFDPETGERCALHKSLLDAQDAAIHGKSDTGLKHLTTTIDLRDAGLEPGRVSFTFQMQLPAMCVDQAGAGGFPILQFGDGGPGTVLLSYLPVQGSTTHPHMLIASVVGDSTRKCTVTPSTCGYFVKVFLEYNGSDLLLVVGDSSDSFHASQEIPPATSPTQLLFAADIANMAFNNLAVYNAAISANSDESPTGFPYILWDNHDSGVVAVLPVSTQPGEVVAFVDRGFTAGHAPATLDLTTAQTIKPGTLKLYVNEYPVNLLGFTGGNTAALISWLTTTNNGEFSFPFDGKTETLKFTSADGNQVNITHKRGATLGQMSFSVRLDAISSTDTAITGGNWSQTMPILGKIPQQFYLPHTGMLNEGISIIGATKQVTSPTALKISRRDDAVRTVGKVIGSVKNRPTSRSMLETLPPIPFLGSAQAPYPANGIVWGNPGKVGVSLPPETSYAYGITWNRYMASEPAKVVMIKAPYFRSRTGDTFAAFSMDIPYGKVLRGLNINFVSMPPGLEGNTVSQYPGQAFDWGLGAKRFGMALTGNADYTAIFTLSIAMDDEGMFWRTIPSLGADAVKVSGANTWKEIAFRTIDYETLLDMDGKSLLKGSRRVHFKLDLANELTAVTYGGLSYYLDSVSKK